MSAETKEVFCDEKKYEGGRSGSSGIDTWCINGDLCIRRENSYKVGIVKFMDHASLNQIEDSIKTELDKLSAENGTTYDYENYTYDGEGDGSVLN